MAFNTNQGAPVSLRDAAWSSAASSAGDRGRLTPLLRMRAGEAFNTDLDWSPQRRRPAGRRLRHQPRCACASPTRSPRALFVQALVQYNDRIDNWSTNLRLGWLQTANTGLFIVYNENREVGGLPVGLARPQHAP